MRFVLASYGSRGDVEPCAAVGRELLRRGHEVRVAVAPDLVGFAESTGLAAVPYGLETRRWVDGQRDFETSLFRHFWKIRELIKSGRKSWELFTQSWEDISATLMSLSEGADLL
ncbi:MAG: glycosyltransferase, partial [Terriglobia bacterium]